MKSNDVLEGIFAFRLDKEIYVSASGKIHRNPGSNRTHLPKNSIIAINVPESAQWSGVRIKHNQYYRLTSKKKIRLHAHHKDHLIKIEDYDVICGYAPSADQDINETNLIRKFGNFLIWLGEKEAEKYNQHIQDKIESSTSTLPNLSDIQSELDKEDFDDIEEEYNNSKCQTCDGKYIIYNIKTHLYEDCPDCKNLQDDDEDSEDECPF